MPVSRRSTASATPSSRFGGFAGARPTLANVDTNAIPPLVPTAAGGTTFDLAELADDPLVLSGDVDLDAIAYVRLVDVVDGEQVVRHYRSTALVTYDGGWKLTHLHVSSDA